VKTPYLFIVSPLIGAVIGFLTNVVAIKMLFRPHREIRIFGVRLPFTPGILPRQRHKLAQSIGGMVERELLTPEVVRQRLGRDDVREKIRESISLLTGRLLASPPGELISGHETFLVGKICAETDKLYPWAAGVFMEFLRSNTMRRELESRGRVFLNQVILNLNVFQRFFMSASGYDEALARKMPEIADELIANAENLLKDKRVKNTLTAAAADALGQIITGRDKSLAARLDLGGEEKKKLDDFIFERALVLADGQIEGVLASIDIAALVKDRIDSLEMLRVERIILDVMADQFMWIDIFGAILGFLIGLFQAGFYLLLGG
jgi:uncharacterized membrane protein YheB (UPF0754 family)